MGDKNSLVLAKRPNVLIWPLKVNDSLQYREHVIFVWKSVKFVFSGRRVSLKHDRKQRCCRKRRIGPASAWKLSAHAKQGHDLRSDIDRITDLVSLVPFTCPTGLVADFKGRVGHVTAK